MSLQNLLIGDQKKYWERITAHTLTTQDLTLQSLPVRTLKNGTITFSGTSTNIAAFNSGSAIYNQTGNVIEIYFECNVTTSGAGLAALVINFDDFGLNLKNFTNPNQAPGVVNSINTSNIILVCGVSSEVGTPHIVIRWASSAILTHRISGTISIDLN